MVAVVLSMPWRCRCSASSGLAVSKCGSRCHIRVRSWHGCSVLDAVALLVLCQSRTGCFYMWQPLPHMGEIFASRSGTFGTGGAVGALPVPTGCFYVWQPLSHMGAMFAWLQWYLRCRGALGALAVPDWPFLSVAAAVTYGWDLGMVAVVLSMPWRSWCSASPGLAVSTCGSRCHLWVRSLLGCSSFDAVVLLVLGQSRTGRLYVWQPLSHMGAIFA